MNNSHRDWGSAIGVEKQPKTSPQKAEKAKTGGKANSINRRLTYCETRRGWAAVEQTKKIWICYDTRDGGHSQPEDEEDQGDQGLSKILDRQIQLSKSQTLMLKLPLA
jgi:hypothetical protein